jgi:hypothetical protein
VGSWLAHGGSERPESREENSESGQIPSVGRLFSGSLRLTMQTNFRDILYLSRGTESQRLAYQCLCELDIFAALAHYDPVLVSSVCLDIDTPQSDLDIICEVHNVERFERDVGARYAQYPRFTIRRSSTNSQATVCQFFTPNFEIEIFGEAVPVERQNGFRHLVQIERAITLGGSPLREELRALKLRGEKTEPALASLLSLEGDPYQAVLLLEQMSDEAIRIRSGL